MTPQATNQYPASHEDLQAPLGGTLREYPDHPGGTYVEEIFKDPTRTLSMGFLADRMSLDTAARDVGSVYVQTVDYSRMVDGKPVRERYYFTGEGMVDHQTGRGMLIEGDVNLRDPQYDITVNRPWHTPMGPTNGVVEAVAVPYTRGHLDGSGTRGAHPPTIVGHQRIEKMLEDLGR